MRSNPVAILLVVLLSCGVSCSGRPFAEGSSRELTVITSLPPDAPELLLLRAVVERTAVRIDDEKAYVVTLAKPDDASAYRARNVIVVGFGSERDVPGPARRLHRLLPHAGGEPFAFTSDVWLRGQAAGLIWADTREAWIPAVTKFQNRLFQGLDRATFAGVRERMAALPEDAAVENELRHATGVSMRVPRGMKLTLDRSARAALLIEEGPPARLLRLAVASGPLNADPWHAREALAKRFRPDEITLDVAEPLLSPDVMAGATRQLHGRWQDSAVSAAGPYRYYEVTRGTMRLQIDLAVFAPGRPKLPYLRELHAIAETATPSR
jgi:hypothetical protein